MVSKTFSFSSLNEYSYFFISDALKMVKKGYERPVILCIGSDLVLGDSLGPLVGSLLVKKNIDGFVYGTLENPLTAKEVPGLTERIRKIHPKSPILAIDAAVGDKLDVGIIKVINNGIKPGLGVKKDLEMVGDYSLIGIVADKAEKNILIHTRLNLIYRMAEQIVKGVLLHVNSQARLVVS